MPVELYFFHTFFHKILIYLHNSSFTATFDGSENDVRFLYSACCISYILNDWSSVDKEAATKFLFNCLTYEGAFGQNPRKNI